jgi:hypothetical protein
MVEPWLFSLAREMHVTTKSREITERGEVPCYNANEQLCRSAREGVYHFIDAITRLLTKS